MKLRDIVQIVCISSLAVGESFAADKSAGAERIVLDSGAEITASVLKETEGSLYLDLGPELIKVPRPNVRLREEVSDEEPGSAGGAAVSRKEGELFHTRATRKSQSVTKWVDKMGEGVVEIRSRASQGSGFVINAEGYVLTNHHVIAGDTEFTITVFSGNGQDLKRIQYKKIEIVAMDPMRDIALLRILDEPQKPFVWLPLGNSNDVKTGLAVFAQGSPLGLDRTVSRGIVSLADRHMNGNLYIQTTAQINPGNSGGPLLNLYGEVVGINTLKLMATGVEGVGFAVPSETVKYFLAKRSAYSFDPRNPNAGFRYLNPPRKSAPPADKAE